MGMEVLLSPECARAVLRLVGDGRFPTPEAAVEAALLLLDDRAAATPLRRAVTLGLEQVGANRSAPLTADDVVRRSMRKAGAR